MTVSNAMKAISSTGQFAVITVIANVGWLLSGCESIDDPTSSKIALYDSSITERIAREDGNVGDRDQDYYEDWKAIYLNKGYSNNEAIKRAADRHYFKFRTFPSTKKSTSEDT